MEHKVSRHTMELKGLGFSFRVEQKELTASQKDDVRQGWVGVVYNLWSVGLISQALGLVTWSESHLYHLISIWPWAIHSPSLTSSFLNCKIGVIAAILKICFED